MMEIAPWVLLSLPVEAVDEATLSPANPCSTDDCNSGKNAKPMLLVDYPEPVATQ